MACIDESGVEKIILGSRSPRRQRLLASIVGSERLLIRPPESADELSFSDLSDETEIEQRMKTLVAMKQTDVLQQLRRASESTPSEYSSTVSSQQHISSPEYVAQHHAVIVADTLVIARQQQGRRIVLGQPDPAIWRTEVRNWLKNLLSGKPHSVWTCFSVTRGQKERMQVVKTEVSFIPLTDTLIDWYLSTGESQGKAGGYGIQGHAAAFVCGLHGSLTNVIGLPLMEVTAALCELGIKLPQQDSA